ncbi:MAG: 3'(2'),5'-bisphosphate nucleotidase CysQ family protein [Beijerinckiaceae bacterium]
MPLAIDDTLLRDLAAMAADAGAVLMAADRRAGLTRKADGSIVTAADLACEQHLRQRLAQRLPGVAIVGEESAPADGRLPDDATLILLDPLDGTAAYAEGRDDYSVNIALVRHGQPVLGILAVPAQGQVYAGLVDGASRTAWRCPVSGGALAGAPAVVAVRSEPATGPVGLVSERHGDARSEAALVRAGVSARRAASSAMKFALLAAGQGDLYPRFGPTMAWDTAAGQALLEAAGGCVIAPETGQPLRYPAGAPLHNGAFIAASSLPLARRAAAL